MAIEKAELGRQLRLRTHAASKLSGDDGQLESRLSSSAAMRVLHGLASSPATAADAIALLHELQVHQVELDLQYEELQGTNAELEANLDQQTRLYQHAPVAMFSVDPNCALIDLNLAGARMLGQQRHAVLGQPLTQYLTSESKKILRAATDRVQAGQNAQSCTLELAQSGAAPIAVHASLDANPAGPGFLMAFSRSPEH